MLRTRWIHVCAAALGTALLAPTALAADCDAQCLRTQLDRYLAALTARNPAALRVAPNLRFTENGAARTLGAGLWQQASGLGAYRQYFADPVSGQAMFIGIVNEGAAPAILALRLAVSGGQLTQVEHIVARQGSHALFAPDAFVKPHESLARVVEPSRRSARARMIAIAESYFVGIERHDSKIVLANDGCQRIENGVPTTNQPGRASRNCAHSADLLTYIKAVNDRRYPIVDPEHGVVVSIILFDIPGETTTASSPQISSDPQVAARMRQPRTLLLAEWFKIEAEQIQHIEAIMHNLPHGSKSGWEVAVPTSQGEGSNLAAR